MTKHRVLAIVIIVLSILGGYFVYATQKNPQSSYHFKLGLDLSGGTHLVYSADTSKIAGGDVNAAMQTLQDVIERRVNLFGVSEPLIQTENSSVLNGDQHELIVELPGVTDINDAIAAIGQTPVLDFRLQNNAVVQQIESSSSTPTQAELNAAYTDTGLTGQYLSNAQLEFNPQTGAPIIGLTFNSQGAALFDQITKQNVGKTLAIFLDSQIISAPAIDQEISGGQAQITGTFSVAQAQTLVRNLNFGALPVPITLVGSQQIGASLGSDALAAGVKAGVVAFIIIALFLILYYRLPGLIATCALAVYVIINLLLYKLLPGPLQIVLTEAGIAGFILSIGMAVDANILIFERMKEELRRGRKLTDAMHEGFARAWNSIRDSNLSSIITALVLYIFASTPIIKGFAYVFGIGVLTSMFTAITVSRTFLYAVAPKFEGKLGHWLFNHKESIGKESVNSNGQVVQVKK